MRGSSPHTRGALPPLGDLRSVSGIIPAYAGSTPWPCATRCVPGDHPRIRGEHHRLTRLVVGELGIIPAYAGSTKSTPCFFRRLSGSSPHTRGARVRVIVEEPVIGIIPAYAGSTRRRCRSLPADRDHPRIRGEHRSSTVSGRPSHGSSPHTRGARAERVGQMGRIPDHPRIRGEHVLRNDVFECQGGSSPHTRGAHVNLLVSHFNPSDHPRIRGEHGDEAGEGPVGPGSSPHTRGAHRPLGTLRQPRRIIPAYAGSTCGWRAVCGAAWDHPRIRGEHKKTGKSDAFDAGSSPHTRGAQERVTRRAIHRGIIPAYAGSTSETTASFTRRPDHPRIRGEHVSALLNAIEDAGSSPHTRGARPTSWPRRQPCGIIPAYAGSTELTFSAGVSRRDHPRIRGEHAALASQAHSIAGSSPHTRGARARTIATLLRSRIIPAYAGSTIAASWSSPAPMDHPRIRGEHPPSSKALLPGRGSSPHTRGALHDRVGGQAGSGIIPAYAGSTIPLT